MLAKVRPFGVPITIIIIIIIITIIIVIIIIIYATKRVPRAG